MKKSWLLTVAICIAGCTPFLGRRQEAPESEAPVREAFIGARYRLEALRKRKELIKDYLGSVEKAVVAALGDRASIPRMKRCAWRETLETQSKRKHFRGYGIVLWREQKPRDNFVRLSLSCNVFCDGQWSIASIGPTLIIARPELDIRFDWYISTSDEVLDAKIMGIVRDQTGILQSARPFHPPISARLEPNPKDPSRPILVVENTGTTTVRLVHVPTGSGHTDRAYHIGVTNSKGHELWSLGGRAVSFAPSVVEIKPAESYRRAFAIGGHIRRPEKLTGGDFTVRITYRLTPLYREMFKDKADIYLVFTSEPFRIRGEDLFWPKNLDDLKGRQR